MRDGWREDEAAPGAAVPQRPRPRPAYLTPAQLLRAYEAEAERGSASAAFRWEQLRGPDREDEADG